jgi:hypothetical protein
MMHSMYSVAAFLPLLEEIAEFCVKEAAADPGCLAVDPNRSTANKRLEWSAWESGNTASHCDQQNEFQSKKSVRFCPLN